MPEKKDNAKSYGFGGAMGLPADASGGPTVDPTKNVLDLVNAAVKRIDDIADLRASHIKDIADIRDKHYKELNDKESSRLDSIRQVDVQNQALAAKAALDAIQALAATTTVNADNIRNALTATTASNAKATTDLATSIAASTAATAEGLSIRIAALEKANAEGIGKGRIADPQLEALTAKVDALATARNVQVGSDPAIAETLATIMKTQTATAQEISSLQNSRSLETGKTTQSSSIFSNGATIISTGIALVLLALRFFGK